MSTPLRLAAVLSLALSGCVAVKPYERERLASPEMESPFAPVDLAAHRDKVVQTRTAGGLPGGVVGGGCGCTQ
jgi:hypothetical protein